MGAESDRPTGRGLAIASIALIPAIIIAFLVGVVVGSLLLQALGLTPEDQLREAGAIGILGGLALTCVICVPQALGLWLGLRARRLGQGRLAMVGIIANGALLMYLIATNGIGLIVG